MANKRTVKITNRSDVFAEYDAAAGITPGMLVELTSNSTVQAHSTAGGNAVRAFALEDELQGRGVNTAYTTGEKVQVWYPGRGDTVWAILADGNNASVGSFLESDGNGMLQVHTADTESFESAEAGAITVYPEQIVGVALEAINISDSSGAESSGDLGYDKRILVGII